MIANPEDKKEQAALDRYREAAAEFAGGSVPPLMSGHWFLKRDQTVADRTWTDVGIVLAWMTKQYETDPPFTHPDGSRACGNLDFKLEYAADVLPRGVDVSWVYYTPAGAIFSLSVVCCPNHFHPRIPCPLPPT